MFSVFGKLVAHRCEAVDNKENMCPGPGVKKYNYKTAFRYS